MEDDVETAECDFDTTLLSGIGLASAGVVPDGSKLDVNAQIRELTLRFLASAEKPQHLIDEIARLRAV